MAHKTVRELIEDGRQGVLGHLVEGQKVQIEALEKVVEALRLLGLQISEMSKRLDKLSRKG